MNRASACSGWSQSAASKHARASASSPFWWKTGARFEWAAAKSGSSRMRTAEGIFGLVEPPEPAEGNAEVAAEGALVGIERDSPRDPLDGLAVAAALVGDDAEQVPGPGVVGLGFERGAVERLGLIEPPRLVQADGGRHALGGRGCHGIPAPGIAPFRPGYPRVTGARAAIGTRRMG